jgi:large subunit ribosomal protein L17
MRHKKAGKRLGRTSSHRIAMFRNMVTSLFEHERIITTTEKAKEVRPIAEKLITLAKRGDMHARRQALSYIRSKAVVEKLFTDIKEKFVNRNGGYTRILQTGVRKGDAAGMAIFELVGYEEIIAAPKAES